MMLTSAFRESDLAPGTRVRVYRNLHRNCYSVMERKTSRVRKHQFHVVLENASFLVRQHGRERVLREKKKNVHAFVCGEILNTDFRWPDVAPREAFYNPYKVKTFVDKETGEALESAAMVLLTPETIYYWKERE